MSERKEAMNCDINMSPLEITTALNTLAVVVSEGLDTDELDLIGAMLTQLADTLFTISALRSMSDCGQ